MNKREAFFRNRIQSTLQELQPLIGEASYTEYMQKANSVSSLEELISLSDLQLQIEYIDYMCGTRQNIQAKHIQNQERGIADNCYSSPAFEAPKSKVSDESIADDIDHEEYIPESEIEQDPIMLAMYFRAQLQKSEAQDMADALLDAFDVVDDSAEIDAQEEQEEQDISNLADALLDYDDTDYSDIEAGVEYETIQTSSLEEQQASILESLTADMSESIADTEDDLMASLTSNDQDFDDEDTHSTDADTDYPEYSLSESDFFGSDEQGLGELYDDTDDIGDINDLDEDDFFGSDDTDDTEDLEQNLDEDDFFGSDDTDEYNDSPTLNANTLFGMGDMSEDEYDDWSTADEIIDDADDTIDLFTGETVKSAPSISNIESNTSLSLEDSLFGDDEENEEYDDYADTTYDLSPDSMFGDDEEDDDYSDYEDDDTEELSDDSIFGDDNDEEDDYSDYEDDSIELSEDNMFGDDDEEDDYSDYDDGGSELSDDSLFGDDDDEEDDYIDSADELSPDNMFDDDDEDDYSEDDDDGLSPDNMFDDDDTELSDESLFGDDEDDYTEQQQPIPRHTAPSNTQQPAPQTNSANQSQNSQRKQVFTRGEHAAETQKMFDNFGSGVSKLLRAANKTGKAAKSHAAKAKDTAKKSSFFNLDNDS